MTSAAVTGLLYPVQHLHAQENPGAIAKGLKARIVTVTAPTATSAPDIRKGVVDAETVKAMVFTGIRNITGTDDIATAFERFFPGITQNSRITIKVNLSNPRLHYATHVEVVSAVVDGLHSMLGNSFPCENITVYDNNDAMLKENTYFYKERIEKKGVRLSCAADFTPSNHLYLDSQLGIHKDIMEADYLVNIPALRDHSEAGITASIKNYVGCIQNQGAIHRSGSLSSRRHSISLQ
ncbi:MAG: hypothetical protein A2268_12875 [Candidatus Raymondbacteria bacterium RifOxyA12_full_50_37]|uniref:DUF362 domain-containing protein n=1 Tax=Candidatus Raymondbacteria bacterium RIFOXYD12_FULL_49_13 TaxID=1817890 RepID=A0A1F7FJM5_UNCRA|nr:MAG: hypothetical protein A2268_12875 [Candidatus Raymondbacteria bacterium RifOxyA12_full_50_37]OGJ90770.1 MAG: hypothetical protein A2248_02115 [Candidatus Raymondbacteria bacterium RIFOXYA2_FULL_49_16]OGJ91649.1 MAG: hypothetical protein A2350_00400 [Candidatus Raymondbacteria bacterium RifOxyB12_full_50_8]OGJ97264.1 MAG: hypothetical protein A2487_16305 [Candidatus Raymondbacteria bacterium RifOxyC12_full_50_8]OGJ97337.1 MAG: hypothetical protein A2453_03395 [Candidatus Raymondbacteria b